MVKLDHPVEKLIQTITFKGVEFDVVERPDVLWVGCVNYAPNNSDESDIGGTLKRYQEELVDVVKLDLINSNWGAALSINYNISDKPKGVMFAQETYSDKQDERYELFLQPGGLWLRVKNDTKNAATFFGRESYGTFEYFGVLYEAAKENGYTKNPNINIEVEYGSTTPKSDWAYVPIIKKD